MYTIRKMTQSYAKDYLNWHYPAPYEFYNIPKEYHEAELKAIMAPSAHWFCVEKSGSEMVGFYQYTPLKNGTVEIGLGLKPDYTGKGYGLKFVRGCVQFGRQQFGGESATFLLRVAEFNKRAIKTYRRAGFQDCGRAQAMTRTMARAQEPAKPVSFICMKLSA